MNDTPQEAPTPRTDKTEAPLTHWRTLPVGSTLRLVDSNVARRLETDLSTALNQLRQAREIITELLFAAENADETGYVTDVGFINLDELHEKARALTTSAPKGEQG